MDAALLLQVGGLALLDALNPATIATVALILVSPLRHPVATALAFVAGAYLVVLALGAAMLGAAEVAIDVVADAGVWVRRVALTLAGILLLHAAYRRLRDRTRSEVTLPTWVGPWTAVPLGVLVTGADLPNAFPYLVAVERMVAAGLTPAQSLPLVMAYALVYVGPCLALVAAAVLARRRIAAPLSRVHSRFMGRRTVRRSRRAAALLAAAGFGILSLAVVV